jgi:hypothetical protein
MARVRWNGQEFLADPVRQNPDGSWVMTARAHTARTVPGTEITVQKAEIIEMAAAEQPGADHPSTTIRPPIDRSSTAGLAAVEAAMAAERATLEPITAATLAKAAKDFRHDAPDHGVSVPPNPPQAPAQQSPAPQPPGDHMSSDRNDRLRGKLAAAAGVVKHLSDELEARADAIIARKDTIAAQADHAFAPHEAALASHEAGLREVEDALRLLDNGGPSGSDDSSKR